jgi:hypothetical protein
MALHPSKQGRAHGPAGCIQQLLCRSGTSWTSAHKVGKTEFFDLDSIFREDNVLLLNTEFWRDQIRRRHKSFRCFYRNLHTADITPLGTRLRTSVCRGGPHYEG